MQLDSGAIVAICLFGATQTGALIYFAGKIATKLERHSDEICEIKTECKERRKVCHLKGA